MSADLSSIQRKLLDFDFEKLCSISLSNINVYGCLICGKYYQGKSPNSHAFIHALQASHHLFINLENGKVFQLPENIEIIDESLRDIQYNLNPRYSAEEIKALDTSDACKGLNGVQYLPGLIGLNNIKETDWFNVVLQALMRIRPLRDFFLVDKHWEECNSVLVKRFGEFTKKFWNRRNYRSHVSPHELIQAVSSASAKKYKIGVRSDPLTFLCWFLNILHEDLVCGFSRTNTLESSVPTGTVKRKKIVKKKSIITKVFRGKVGIREKPIDDLVVNLTKGEITSTNFMYLSLNLPMTPLFKDRKSKDIIPQIPLFTLLEKFDGIRTEMVNGNALRTCWLNTLPPFLIIHYGRFTKNNFFVEKNHTLVNFPLTNLDLAPCMPCEVVCFYINSVDLNGANEVESTPETRYDLLVNIVHDGDVKIDVKGKNISESFGQFIRGSYKAHVYHEPGKKWYEIQDLHVTETMPQLVGLSESYIQVWQRQDHKLAG